MCALGLARPTTATSDDFFRTSQSQLGGKRATHHDLEAENDDIEVPHLGVAGDVGRLQL